MTRRPSDPTQPPVFGANHSAYRCRNAEQTRAFYEDLLGFPLVQALDIKRHPTTGEPVRYMHIFFDIGSHDPDEQTYIAFFEVAEDIGEVPDFEFKTQWGMDLHFAMGVASHDDLESWRKRLMARGLDVDGPIDHGIFSSIYFHDPNGYRLEFTAQNPVQLAEFKKERARAHAILGKWTAAG